MIREADIFGSSIVALGDFNPVIFSPDWLGRNQLIGQSDIDNANNGSSLIISQQLTVFETGWFTLQVLNNQLSLISKGALTLAFRDLAVGIFTLVSHTPISAIGLNFSAHFRFSTEEYHKIGDVLAPKTIWNSLYPDKYSAGLANLTIKLQDSERGKSLRSSNEKNISVQPSDKLKNGVLLSLNDHRKIVEANDNNMTAAEQTATLIDAEWEKSRTDAIETFDAIISRTLSITMQL